LEIDPDHVYMNKAKDEPSESPSPFVQRDLMNLGKGVYLPGLNFDQMSTSGTVGVPSEGSAVVGRNIIDEVVKNIKAFLKDFLG
jgi:creatinine amidohydrolase/Fe(II)-dependent formamide hydrolase-like protein